MFRSGLKNFAVLVVLLAVAQGAFAANYTLKFATMAPDGSAWMQRFDQMKKDVSDATGGQVILKIYPGGVLGEEKDVLFKIKVGQIDGAGFMGHGVGGDLSRTPARMMLPMVFSNYEEVDCGTREDGAVSRGAVREERVHSAGLDRDRLQLSLQHDAGAQHRRSLRGAKPWGCRTSGCCRTCCSRPAKVSAIPVPVARCADGPADGPDPDRVCAAAGGRRDAVVHEGQVSQRHAAGLQLRRACSFPRPRGTHSRRNIGRKVSEILPPAHKAALTESRCARATRMRWTRVCRTTACSPSKSTPEAVERIRSR